MVIGWVMSEENAKSKSSWETLCKLPTGLAMVDAFHNGKKYILFLEIQ